MIRKFILHIFSLVAALHSMHGQQIMVSGYVSDKESGEKLPFTNIYITELKKGVTANKYGYFRLFLPSKKLFHLQITHLGYQPKTIPVFSGKDLTLNVELIRGEYLDEVSIKYYSSVIKTKNSEKYSLSPLEISRLPSLSGEADILKAYTYLPGIMSSSEGSSKLIVRGGSPEQNLVLLDDVPLYYITHLGGFVSVFDPETIAGSQLIKGGFPAKYGNRLSSILDISMREGNQNHSNTVLSLSLLSAKLFREGPIGKHLTYMISFRRMLYDLLMRPVIYWSTDGTLSSGYYFYDFNTKWSFRPNSKDVWNISAYAGEDVFYVKLHPERENVGGSQGDFSSDYRKRWGNSMIALRWRRLWKEKLESISVLSYAKYRFLFKNKSENNSTSFFSETLFLSSIQNWRLSSRMLYYYNEHNRLETGMELSFQQFVPAVQQIHNNSSSTQWHNQSYSQRAWNTSFFAELHRDTEMINFNAGFRFNLMNVENKVLYFPEPRLYLYFKILPSAGIKLSYSSMSQNIHLLSTNGLGMPVDFWLPATSLAPPETSGQIAAGFHVFLNPFTLDISGYVKNTKHLIIYKPGRSFLNFPEHWEDLIYTEGNGSSKGLEILLEAKQKKNFGWISYTLSNTLWKFKEINNGSPFPSHYDIRHKIDIMYNRKLNKFWDLSVVWQFMSGRPVTMAIAKYGILGPAEEFQSGQSTFQLNEAYLFSDFNGVRTKAYHRLDVGLTYTRQKKHGKARWKFNIINAYNRKNAYFYFFTDKKVSEDTYRITLKQFTLFPLFLSVGYSRSF